MKKIISSAIAIAMLSSTVAMAATVVAPTPQNETTTYTQNFDGETTKDTNDTSYGTGAVDDMTVQQGADVKVAVEANPFGGAEATDKILKLAHTDDQQIHGNYTIPVNSELNDGDMFKVSFDAAWSNAAGGDSYIKLCFKMNNETTRRSVFKLFASGWVGDYNCTDSQPAVTNPSATAFTHYEVVFDTASKKITITSGTTSNTYTMKSTLPDITSVQDFYLETQHKNSNTAAEGFLYLDNMSYSVTHVTNETVETFDTVNQALGGGWNKSQTLTNAKFLFKGANVDNTQDIETPSNRGKVLKLSGGSDPGNYVAMPLNYTMDNDDVFTFQFDYASSAMPVNNQGCTDFMLEDYSRADKRNMGFTFKDPTTSEELTTSSSFVFRINDGYLLMANAWGHYGTKLQPNKFYKITVVIDNSDDEIKVDDKPQRTLAVYVDGVLQSTKWIMTDNDGKESSNTINGVSLVFGGTYDIKYFDNLWASLADNDIKVDGNDVSYTYPVVYDTDTNAIFVKAYYDTNNRLISADTADAKPSSSSRTVSTTLNKPEGTVKTKVFRWDSLDGIHQLSPAYDSSKTSTTN